MEHGFPIHPIHHVPPVSTASKQEQFPRASDIEADIKKQEETAVKARELKWLDGKASVDLP